MLRSRISLTLIVLVSLFWVNSLRVGGPSFWRLVAFFLVPSPLQELNNYNSLLRYFILALISKSAILRGQIYPNNDSPGVDFLQRSSKQSLTIDLKN